MGAVERFRGLEGLPEVSLDFYGCLLHALRMSDHSMGTLCFLFYILVSACIAEGHIKQ